MFMPFYIPARPNPSVAAKIVDAGAYGLRNNDLA